MRLAFFLSLFICPKDTAQCDEESSLHVLIDVLIFNREVVMEIKTLAGGSNHLPGPELMIAYPL
jgi:hypothetical protein